MSNARLPLQALSRAVNRLMIPLRALSPRLRALTAVLQARRERLAALNPQTGRLNLSDGVIARSDAPPLLTGSTDRPPTSRLRASQWIAPRLARPLPSADQPDAQVINRLRALQSGFHRLSLVLQQASHHTRQLILAQQQLSQACGPLCQVRLPQPDGRSGVDARQTDRPPTDPPLASREAAGSPDLSFGQFRQHLACRGSEVQPAGLTVSGLLAGSVRAYAQAEQGSAQLTALMMMKGGVLPPELSPINSQADQLAVELPGSREHYQAMMRSLVDEKMSPASILGGGAQASSYLALQQNIAPSEAARYLARLQRASQSSPGELLDQADTVQRADHAGIDPDTLLAGLVQLREVRDRLTLGGAAGTRALATLLLMAQQQQISGNAAGEAYRQGFNTLLDPQKIAAVNQRLTGSGVQLDFTPGKGELGAIEQVYQQLEQLNSLPASQRSQTLQSLAGGDPDTLTVLNMMQSEGLAGYRAAAARLAQQASLAERVATLQGTLEAKWERASEAFNQVQVTFAASGEPLLKGLADWLAELALRVNTFLIQHPQLTRTLFTLAAGFAAVSTVLGNLAQGVATLRGPFTLLRGAFNWLALNGPAALGLLGSAFGTLGNAVLGLGRLLLANPILAFIALIAGGALYVWRNWETLGPKFIALWQTITGAVSQAWGTVREFISIKWQEIIADVEALPARFAQAGAALIDSLLAGINEKWQALKTKLESLADFLPDWLKPGEEPSTGRPQGRLPSGYLPPGYLPPGNLPPGNLPKGKSSPAAARYSGLYDKGGVIGAGQFGLAGEHGPEIIHGPAQVTSRASTAALASVVASMMGVAALPAEAAPLHPLSRPASHSRMSPPASARPPQVMHVETHAPITIHAQPGQSAQDIAREVARQLDAREQGAAARARSQFRDQGGYDL